MPSASSKPLRTVFLAVLLASLASLGCVDHNTKAALYVYDAGTSTVQEWDDVNAVRSATTSAAADRSFTATSWAGKLAPLAWGGLALDTSLDRIYLVGETGTVYVVLQASSQSGTISGISNLLTFTLDPTLPSGASLGGSVFGQVAVDRGSHALYVMETATDGSAARVWNIPSSLLNSANSGSSLDTSLTFKVAGDKWGAGLAVATGGTVYGQFGTGNTFYTDVTLATPLDGERLRQGQGGFPSSIPNIGPGALIGASTQLNVNAVPAYGSLAFDSQNNLLYAFTQPRDNPAQVLVFSSGQFTAGGLNQAPKRVLADAAADLAGLRVIAHPPADDWLLGAFFTAGSSGSGTGQGLLRVWKDPSGGGAGLTVTMTGATQIRGMALGSNN